ncbi:MAG: hypothetical protein JW810_09540 [Sedimentisphaerales bacterium]|nr:hypothetical protein [Sedimentisphaerales bacterium]
MKKVILSTLAVAMVIGLALSAWAQQDDARRQRRQQQRLAQQQAIEMILTNAAKLKAQMEEASQAMQNRTQMQDMSEEERTQLRETFMKQREERQKLIADLELQIAILKGPRQLRTEHEEAQAELQAIRDLAAQEKAEQTAERLAKLIDKSRLDYENTLKAMGVEM